MIQLLRHQWEQITDSIRLLLLPRYSSRDLYDDIALGYVLVQSHRSINSRDPKQLLLLRAYVITLLHHASFL